MQGGELLFMGVMKMHHGAKECEEWSWKPLHAWLKRFS
jgi:hypothetical protein